MADEYKLWERLTPMEKLYIATNPHHAFAIKDSKKTAFAETLNRFGKNGHNDESDAFRHCFWSSILARELGFQNALRFTTFHEGKKGNPAAEREMDLHNNFVGLNIGKQFIHIAPGVGEYIESDKELSNRCYTAYTEGKLKVALSKNVKMSKY